MQVLVYPNKSYGWIAMHDKNKEGKGYTARSLIKVGVEILTSSNVKVHRPYNANANDFEFFQSCVSPIVASSLSVSSVDYKIESARIAMGMQGETFLGKCILNDEKMLLKKLKYPLIYPNGELREGFISKNLSHESVREMKTAWVDESGTCWIALDHHDGTLTEYLNEEKKAVFPERLTIFIQIASAANYFHKNGVVHMDIQPDNVLLSGVQAVLADMGSSVLLDGKKCEPSIFQSWNPYYAAPELKPHEEHTAMVDVYSLALLYFTLMSSVCKEATRLARIKELRALARSEKWKRGPRKAWEESKLSKGFQGNVDILIRMLDSNPEMRPDVEEVLNVVGDKSQHF